MPAQQAGKLAGVNRLRADGLREVFQAFLFIGVGNGARRDRQAVMEDPVDGRRQLFGGHVFQQVAAGAGIQRIPRQALFYQVSQPQDQDLRPTFMDGARGLDSIDDRHF